MTERTDPVSNTAQGEMLEPPEGAAKRVPIGLRALDTGPGFWLAMFLASAFGTNFGDFWAGGQALGHPAGFMSLVLVSALALWGDRRAGLRTEGFYWVAIVALRAAATNAGDFLTHDLGLSYAWASAGMGMAALLAGCFTRSPAPGGGSPVIDGWYWGAMFAAGVFGTVAGDLTAHAAGLIMAAVALVAVLLLVLGLRAWLLPTFMAAYWCAVLAERCAATPVGDALASRRGAGLGLPLAMACTGSLLLAALAWRRWGALGDAPGNALGRSPDPGRVTAVE